MNPIWQRLDAIAGAAVNAVYGEAVRIKPRKSNEYVEAGPDLDRVEANVVGVFADEPSVDDLRGQRISGESRGVVQAKFAQASVQIMAAEVAKIVSLPVEGDSVVLPSRLPPLKFNLERSEKLDCGDLVLYLTRE